MILYEKRMTNRSQRSRITITLRSDLLPRIDNFVDGEKIRNRSHAIEYILSQHLGLGIEYAVIFAGADKNCRVHALTRVRNRPIIAYIFDTLKDYGIRDVLIVIDEHGEELRQYLGDGVQWGVVIKYLRDNESRGTAAALALARPFIKKTFLLIYSDVLAELNMVDMVKHHEEHNMVGTVALTYKRSAEQYGVARMQGSKIVDFTEKPGVEGRHGLVNAGIFIFEPTIFEYLKKGVRSLETDVLPRVAIAGLLTGYPFEGKWFDITKEHHRERAEREWR